MTLPRYRERLGFYIEESRHIGSRRASTSVDLRGSSVDRRRMRRVAARARRLRDVYDIGKFSYYRVEPFSILQHAYHVPSLIEQSQRPHLNTEKGEEDVDDSRPDYLSYFVCEGNRTFVQ